MAEGFERAAKASEKLREVLAGIDLDLTPGSLSVLTIAHDDDCPGLNGPIERCTCDPDVSLRKIEAEKKA